jgi:dATP pyrophosphohydrolase
MARVPFQVSVFPFTKTSEWKYAIFRRSVEGYWQSIAGGGEDDELPLDAARREAFEEANIPISSDYLVLKTVTFVPVYHFSARDVWDQNLLVIPQYYFAVATASQLVLSAEHSEFQWAGYETGQNLLHWDSDKTALWELHQILCRERS